MSISPTRSRFSAVATWTQAAVLTALMLPLAATSAEASTITCGYGSGPNSCGVAGGSGNGAGSGTTAFFNFDPNNNTLTDYTVQLTFDQVNGPFSVAITDTLTTQAALAPRFATSFGTSVCVPIFDGVTSCVEFHIVAAPPGPNTWTSAGPRGNAATTGWNLFITWNANTDQPGDATAVRVIHDTGGTDPQYDIDITVPGSYFGNNTCEDVCIGSVDDPGIGSRDNNFQNVTVVRTPAAVPEPASVLLIGSGISALAFRKRRRS